MKMRRWLLVLSAALALLGCERVRDDDPVGVDVGRPDEPKFVKAPESKAAPGDQAKQVKEAEGGAIKAGQAKVAPAQNHGGKGAGIRIGEAVAFDAEPPLAAAGAANRVLSERPPLSETAYRAKYKAFPPNGVIIVPPERRYFRYLAGERLWWDETRGVWLPGEPKSGTPE